MNNKVLYFVIFAAGAAIGFAASYKLVQKKYERIAQEEIESVKKTFKEYYDNNTINEETTDKNEETEKPAEENEDASKYNKLASKYSSGATKTTKGPYVIQPDDFGEYKEYSLVYLTYYSDGVLVDDDDNVIDDIENTVGSEALSSFGEYEDDAVHVRNEELENDYEIVLDSRKYSEVC